MAVHCTIVSPEQRRQLLQFARAAAGQALGGRTDAASEKPKIEGRFGGVFVTFWDGKTLRGCIGSFAATTDLAASVEEVTRSSLTDPRFRADPITAEKLGGLQIEISILSDLEPSSDPASLSPGTHGVVVRRGEQSGCFLPMVAAERGWSATEFLSNCCTMKAGLPADAWRQPDTEVLFFTADAFSESDFA